MSKGGPIDIIRAVIDAEKDTAALLYAPINSARG
jgi:hypothetical protein